MNKHNSVPSIRFNGFKDEWKLSKLGNDLISIHTGTNLLGSETPGGIPLIKMGNLKNGFFDFSKLDYLPICENVKNEDKVRFGDFLFNTRNTLDLVGKGATWMYESTKFAYNNNIAKFNFQNSINTVFFNYLYNTYNVMNQVHARATGTTSVAAIYPKSLDSIIYNLPSKQEQQKIGNFFAKLDKLLDLQQQKIDKLELLKKALLQKLFPKYGAKIPELRFKGFEDDWTDRKFVNCLTKIIDFRGKTPKKLGLSWSNNGKYRALSAINVKNGFIDKNIDVHFGNYDLYKKWMGKTELEKGDILFTTEAPMGNIAIINDNEKYILSQRTVAFRVDEKNINSRFLLYRLNTVSAKNKLMSLSTGGTAQGISQKNLSYLFISISNSIDEQKKIGNILAKVDHLIYLENKKLQNLQQVKKCLLQNMFVE